MALEVTGAAGTPPFNRPPTPLTASVRERDRVCIRKREHECTRARARSRFNERRTRSAHQTNVLRAGASVRKLARDKAELSVLLVLHPYRRATGDERQAPPPADWHKLCARAH